MVPAALRQLVTHHTHTTTSMPQRISEVEAHRLLARAAELDARLGASVDAAQIRSAALEAGISEEAVAQASAELEAGRLGSPSKGAALTAMFAVGGRVLAAAALVIWALADAGRPVAQLLALTVAVYGAYDILSRSARWLRNRWEAQRHRRSESTAPERASNRESDGTARSVRLVASAFSRGAA